MDYEAVRHEARGAIAQAMAHADRKAAGRKAGGPAIRVASFEC
jgi:hypothetical protein